MKDGIKRFIIARDTSFQVEKADDGLVKSHRLSMTLINCFRKFTYVALASNVSFFKQEEKEDVDCGMAKIKFSNFEIFLHINFVISFSYSSRATSKDRHIHNFRKSGRIAWWLRTGFYRIRVGAAVPGIGTQDDRSMVFNC